MSTWGGPVDVILTGGRVVTPGGVLENGWVSVRDGRIAAVGEGVAPEGPVTDVSGCTIVPGFVDIHCHGGGGDAFTSRDPAKVRKAASAHRKHGTTTLLASLVSRPVPELADQVSALAELTQEGVVGHRFHLVLDGAATVLRGGTPIAEIHAGDFVGEIALLGGGRYTATVRCTETTRCLTIEREPFWELLEAKPEIALRILEVVCRRTEQLMGATPTANFIGGWGHLDD